MEIRSLLLTTDFSAEARKAYPAATSLARRFESAIHLVHVMEPLSFMVGMHTTIPKETYLAELQSQMKREVNLESLQGVELKPAVLTEGLAHKAIEDYVQQEGVGLIVSASHGHSGLGYMLLGSFTQQIIQHATAPVLTYRQKDPPVDDFVPSEVLVPFDFSENAASILPAVRALSETFGSRFTFLHAIEPAPILLSERIAGAVADRIFEATQEASKHAQKQFAEVQASSLEGVSAHLLVTKGFAFHEIVDYARKTSTDLILMSTHGWTGFKHFLLGSVAEKVVRKAPCSVVTIRPREIVSQSS